MIWKQRNAFTQIELIFVIIVIGILAIIALPKLATTRDDANAAKCTQEIQQLISEITQVYGHRGYNEFSILPIEEMTNVNIAVGGDGVSNSRGSLVSDGIIYICDGGDVAEIKSVHNGVEYNLTVTDLNPSEPPAAVTASEFIRKLHNINTAGGSRNYTLSQ